METYGCAMNEADTEIVKAVLTKAQYSFTANEREADIIMLNTCAIRENAHRKVYGRVHEIHHKRKGTPVMIGILGCMATHLRTELFENKKLKVDFIAGPDSYKKLPELIAECTKEEGKKAYDVTLSEFETYSDIMPLRKDGINAWVSVSRGCNNFCTFCVVPYTRGRERSRELKNIVEEVRQLAAEGFKQVTLLGQNVNSYNDGEHDFADLMDAVSKAEGIERVRFTSPHPKDFPHKLLKTIAENPKLCKNIHLPLQAGNNRILNVMDRTYTQEEFRKLAAYVRELMPNVTLSTDIIVGFPTETEEEFKDTVKVMKDVEFDTAFIFKYSERKGTIASRKYPDDVSPEEKTNRIVELVDLQKDIALKKNRAHIGETRQVLIEKERFGKGNDEANGRDDGNKLATFNATHHKQGDLVDVKITDASAQFLKGKVI